MNHSLNIFLDHQKKDIMSDRDIILLAANVLAIVTTICIIYVGCAMLDYIINLNIY